MLKNGFFAPTFGLNNGLKPGFLIPNLASCRVKKAIAGTSANGSGAATARIATTAAAARVTAPAILPGVQNGVLGIIGSSSGISLQLHHSLTSAWVQYYPQTYPTLHQNHLKLLRILSS